MHRRRGPRPDARGIRIAVQAGFSYIEVLIATALVAVALVPALESLSGSVQGSAARRHQLEQSYLLRGRLEELLAEAYADLDTAAQNAGGPANPSSYSDTASLANGQTVYRDVYLAGYDGDNADLDDDPYTGADSGLLWIRVALRNTPLSLQTLVAQ